MKPSFLGKGLPGETRPPASDGETKTFQVENIEEILNADSLEVSFTVYLPPDAKKGKPQRKRLNAKIKHGDREINLPTDESRSMALTAAKAWKWLDTMTETEPGNSPIESAGTLFKNLRGKELALAKATILLLATQPTEQEAARHLHDLSMCQEQTINLFIQGLANSR